MKWIYMRGRCFSVTESQGDLLADILRGVYESLRIGMVEMTPAELEDFTALCAEAGLTLAPLQLTQLPGLRRIK